MAVPKHLVRVSPLVSTIPDLINRVWRIFATGLSFAIFGIGACLISLTLFPLIRLFSWKKSSVRARIQYAMHIGFRLFVLILKSLGLMTLEVHNRERLLLPGQLVVANHPSLIDVVVLISLMPTVDCIVKKGLWSNPFLRWPVIWASYIPNDMPNKLIEDCAASLRSGRSLLIFPEGTRTVPGAPPTLKRGAAQIALASQSDVLPVSISVNPITLTKLIPWYRVPSRRFHMRIVVGQPLKITQFLEADSTRALAARKITEHLRRFLISTGNGSASL